MCIRYMYVTSDYSLYPMYVQVPDIAYVGNQMMRHYRLLDRRADKCKLQRDLKGVTWHNGSNYDELTRWEFPGINGSTFDHIISFRYQRIPGVKAKLENYQVQCCLVRQKALHPILLITCFVLQCRLLVRGQNYEALRRTPLVQSMPYDQRAKIGPVHTDAGLTLIAVVFPQVMEWYAVRF